MNFNTPINELECLREQFQDWKSNNPHKHFPKHLWALAFQLIDKHGIDAVADVLGFFPSYLRQRYERSLPAQETKFVEIETSQMTYESSQHICLHVQNREGMKVELSYQGNVEQSFSLINTLFGAKICSR